MMAEETGSWYGHKASEAGPLDLRALRRGGASLRVELDGGAGRGGAPGDLYPRYQRDTGGAHLHPPRLPSPRSGGVLAGGFRRSAEGGPGMPQVRPVQLQNAGRLRGGASERRTLHRGRGAWIQRGQGGEAVPGGVG